MPALFSKSQFWISVVAFLVVMTLVLWKGAEQVSAAVTSTSIIAGLLIAGITGENVADKLVKSSSPQTPPTIPPLVPLSPPTPDQQNSLISQIKNPGANLILLCLGIVTLMLTGGCSQINKTADAARLKAVTPVVMADEAVNPANKTADDQFIANWQSTGPSVALDPVRYQFVSPLIGEYIAAHPAESQTWADFKTAWQLSITSRGGSVASGP
jgi:hypothetical protein